MNFTNLCGGLITGGLGTPLGTGALITMPIFTLFVNGTYVQPDNPPGGGSGGGTYYHPPMQMYYQHEIPKPIDNDCKEICVCICIDDHEPVCYTLINKKIKAEIFVKFEFMVSGILERLKAATVNLSDNYIAVERFNTHDIKVKPVHKNVTVQ